MKIERTPAPAGVPFGIYVSHYLSQEALLRHGIAPGESLGDARLTHEDLGGDGVLSVAFAALVNAGRLEVAHDAFNAHAPFPSRSQLNPWLKTSTRIHLSQPEHLGEPGRLNEPLILKKVLSRLRGLTRRDFTFKDTGAPATVVEVAARLAEHRRNFIAWRAVFRAGFKEFRDQTTERTSFEQAWGDYCRLGRQLPEMLDRVYHQAQAVFLDLSNSAGTRGVIWQVTVDEDAVRIYYLPHHHHLPLMTFNLYGSQDGHDIAGVDHELQNILARSWMIANKEKELHAYFVDHQEPDVHGETEGADRYRHFATLSILRHFLGDEVNKGTLEIPGGFAHPDRVGEPSVGPRHTPSARAQVILTRLRSNDPNAGIVFLKSLGKRKVGLEAIAFTPSIPMARLSFFTLPE